MQGLAATRESSPGALQLGEGVTWQGAAQAGVGFEHTKAGSGRPARSL